MPAPRETTDAAIDSALHGLPEPQNAWRSQIPPADLGAMKTNGSGQIGLQALVASLHYGPRPAAIEKLNTYADLCPGRFGLSEPWSWIYFKAIVCCWLAVVVIAERHGLRDLATRYRSLIARWAGTCALMAVDGKVLMAGCRCWGHEVKGGGWDDLWAFANGAKEPPRQGGRGYGTPGAYDDWGWLNRCARLGLAELRAIAAPFLGRDWRSLLPSIPRWGARVPMQLIGYEDGSRFSTMGIDESALVDDDPNGNTPGFLAAGVLNYKVVTMPKWPTYTLNDRRHLVRIERLRQTSCRADIDGTPQLGWSLWHSHLGENIGAVGGLVTRLDPYTASPLAFWVECPAGETVWKIHSPAALVHPLENPTPGGGISWTPPVPKPRKRRWWEFWR